MTRKLPLPMAPAQTKLGLPTIMDRDIAGTYGVAYVHLAVFAIDIDRVYWLDPEAEDSELPFGWEVFLTQHYLLSQPAAQNTELLEALCSALLEETPGEPPLGGQIVFAIFDAVTRGKLPSSLSALFRHWKRPPAELTRALDRLHEHPHATAKQLASHCLDANLDPPLAPPTRDALQQIRVQAIAARVTT